MATGGGGGLINTTGYVHIVHMSKPTSTTGTVPNGWSVTVYNGDGATRTLEVYVICAAP